MNKKRFRAINSAARRIRNWAEENHMVFGHDKDLCGMCAIASVQLFKELADSGIDSTIVLNNKGCGSHVYLVVDDLVVDVTATQFGNDIGPVVLIERDQARNEDWWQDGEEFSCPKALCAKQEAEGWPTNQLAFT